MRVLQSVGAIRILARLLRPLLRALFPGAVSAGASEELCAAMAANMLGLGNAATPLAARAMEKLACVNRTPGTASDDMITFAVVNTAPLCIIPSTIIALRYHAGSADPAGMLVPIWICSFCSFAASAFFARSLSILTRKGRERGHNQNPTLFK